MLQIFLPGSPVAPPTLGPREGDRLVVQSGAFGCSCALTWATWHLWTRQGAEGGTVIDFRHLRRGWGRGWPSCRTSYTLPRKRHEGLLPTADWLPQCGFLLGRAGPSQPRSQKGRELMPGTVSPAGLTASQPCEEAAWGSRGSLVVGPRSQHSHPQTVPSTSCATVKLRIERPLTRTQGGYVQVAWGRWDTLGENQAGFKSCLWTWLLWGLGQEGSPIGASVSSLHWGKGAGSRHTRAGLGKALRGPQAAC